MSDRQKITLALVLSALLHVLVLGFFGVLNLKSPKPVPPPVAAKPTPLEITIASFSTPTPRPLAAGATPTPTPMPKAPVEREVIDSSGLAKTQKRNEKALLESDQDLAAGSLLPAVGNVPLPSQTGRKLPFQRFQNQRDTPGQKPGGAASRPGQPAPPTPQNPRKPSTLAQNSSPPQPTPPPESATPAPTPTPPPPADDELFAMGRPTPVPTPSRVPRTLEQLRKELAMLKPTAPTLPPQPAAQAPGFQPQLEKTAIEGGISNRGATGVDAISTTRGRFQKAISDAIGSRWYYYVNQRIDLVTVGGATVRFKIDRTGHPLEPRIIHNSSNETFASVCIQAVREANFPPIPDELLPMMEDGGFEIDYNFTIYPQ